MTEHSQPADAPTASVLAEAETLINGDRQKQYGSPVENLTRIAEQWALYLKQKYGIEVPLIAEDACWMMCDLKKCRQMRRPKRDNIVDAAAYVALIEKVTL